MSCNRKANGYIYQANKATTSRLIITVNLVEEQHENRLKKISVLKSYRDNGLNEISLINTEFWCKSL